MKYEKKLRVMEDQMRTNIAFVVFLHVPQFN